VVGAEVSPSDEEEGVAEEDAGASMPDPTDLYIHKTFFKDGKNIQQNSLPPQRASDGVCGAGRPSEEHSVTEAGLEPRPDKRFFKDYRKKNNVANNITPSLEQIQQIVCHKFQDKKQGSVELLHVLQRDT